MYNLENLLLAILVPISHCGGGIILHIFKLEKLITQKEFFKIFYERESNPFLLKNLENCN